MSVHASGRQKRVLDLLDLGSQVSVVSPSVWALGTELGFSARAAHTLND